MGFVVARAHTGNTDCIVLDGAYHGHTAAVIGLSPYKYQHARSQVGMCLCMHDGGALRIFVFIN